MRSGGADPPDNEPAALAGRTAGLLRDDTPSRRIARAGRTVAEGRFGVRRMVAGYLEVASEAFAGRW